MATIYTGTGGIVQLFKKLKEVYSFKNVVCESEDTAADDAIWRLYVSDEVFIRYQGGAGHGWADMQHIGGICEPTLHVVTGADDRTWKIVTTSYGAAFGTDGDIRCFIASTVDSANRRSVGLAGIATSGYRKVVTDGMTDTAATCQSQWDTVLWTQLVPLVASNVAVGFTDLYFIGCSPESTNRQISLNGGTYYCNAYYALRDTEDTTGSTVDLTGYYTKSQTDAQIAAAVAGVEQDCAAVKVVANANKADIAALDTAVSAASLSIKVYVNAASGNDTNDGLTSSTAFQTLAKAMEIAQTYGMAEIQLAAGEYQFADFTQYIYHGDIRITGAGQDSTTLYAQVYANHANVEIGSLTLDTTHGTSLSAAALTVIHGGTGKLSDVIVTTASNNGVYVGNMGYVFLYNVVINGSTQRMVYVTNDGQATIQTVSGTTESDRPNVLTGSAALVRIVSSPDLTYSTNYTGIVFVDGVQRSPVDLSAVISEG